MHKLLLALCVASAAAAPWPFSMWRGSSLAEIESSVSSVPTHLPDFYHTTPALADKLQMLEHSCDGLTINTMEDGEKKIQVARYKAPSTSTKFKTMVVAGEHARELIGSEIAFNFVMALCGQAPAEHIEEAKKDTEFLVVVNANPGSRSLVEHGDFCTRTNTEHVDINRNFDVDWASAEKAHGDTYPGGHAFDQAEARILKQLMEDFQPHAYLDLHSGFRGMFFPNAVANDADLSMSLQRMTAQIDEDTCKCPLGVANKEVGYHTAGSALDYTFQVLKVPFSMAVEVYLDEAGSQTEIQKLEKRWREQRADLLKPIATGSSFMENGLSPDTRIPMSFIQSADDSESPQNGSDNWCLARFNPVKKDDFDKTLNSWTNAVARLSITSRQVPADAAHKATQLGSLVQLADSGITDEVPKGGLRIAVFYWMHIFAILLKRALPFLGLCLVIFIGFKYYKVKQSKEAESAPFAAQMAPVQISD